MIADIPGLIEGAHEGTGLGDRFLKHVERCAAFLHLIDGTTEDVVAAYKVIRNELELYDQKLTAKPEVVAINKCDALGEKDIKQKIAALEKACGKKVYAISAVAKQGLFDCLLDLNKYITRDRLKKGRDNEQEKEEVQTSWSPL